ncbi:MAG: class I SAM-dependent RNA methyltransferase [Firmicutes bacterium]|nr:class I SAM-dependent RNA methyltransferase [Bacillota bacterium]
MRVEIVKFDNQGRGIGYLNDKIIFIPKTVPGDIINVSITLEKKNHMEGRLLEIITPSKLRQKPVCPYFEICGGCDLMHISISEALDYKLNKVNDILKKNKIDYQVSEIIKSDNPYNYRDKVTLKVVEGKIGFFQSDTHSLVEINYCYLCKKIINKLIMDLPKLNINDGEIVIRCNYNDDILLSITTNDELENIDKLINDYKIVGIVKNDETIYGENYFIDKINNYLFKVSYNSFFQINPFICSKLFELIEIYTKESNKVLDLYCGVGTLSIVSSINASSVVGVEIVENAIIDANLNKNFNGRNNVEFICADTKDILNKITNKFDTIILDPPRSGVVRNVLDKIIEVNPNKIIYVSCDPNTLARDLKLLENNYEINNFKLLDMFPETEHVESIVILKNNSNKM